MSSNYWEINMIELTDLEIGEISGGVSWVWFIEAANAILEFGQGFIDGVNAAQ